MERPDFPSVSTPPVTVLRRGGLTGNRPTWPAYAHTRSQRKSFVHPPTVHVRQVLPWSGPSRDHGQPKGRCCGVLPRSSRGRPIPCLKTKGPGSGSDRGSSRREPSYRRTGHRTRESEPEPGPGLRTFSLFFTVIILVKTTHVIVHGRRPTGPGTWGVAVTGRPTRYVASR